MAVVATAGTTLTDAKRRWQAKVCADGSIACEAHAGSIHKVGAMVQSAPACNGWTYWHAERASGLVLIDSFREKLRAQMR